MRRRDDGGNLMLLAGIVVTIAFVTTALTLSQVASLERQASSEPSTTLAGEWRFLRDRLAASVATSVTVDLTDDAFNDTTLPAVVATFRGIQAEKGYDVAIRRATTLSLFNKTEASIVSGGNYDAWSVNGKHANWPKDSDQTDGILWEAPCADGSGPTTGCIGGVLLSIHLADGESSLSEVILIRTNSG